MSAVGWQISVLKGVRLNVVKFVKYHAAMLLDVHAPRLYLEKDAGHVVQLLNFNI